MRKDLRPVSILLHVPLTCEEELKIQKLREPVVTAWLEYLNIFCSDFFFCIFENCEEIISFLY